MLMFLIEALYMIPIMNNNVINRNYEPLPTGTVNEIISYVIKTLSACVIVLAIFTLSACSQTPDKPAASDNLIIDVNNTPVSASDRETYQNGITALNNGNLSEAERIFEEFIEAKPNLAGAYSNLALIQFNKEKFEHSLDLVNQALQINPEQAQAYQLRAQIFVNKGKIHDARNDYIKAIELKPDYVNAQYNLALLYDIYLQQITLAIEHYENYLALVNNTDKATQEWVEELKRARDKG